MHEAAAGPPLGVALAVGLVVSLLQAVTQINEETLAFVPKVLAIGVALVLSGPFMLHPDGASPIWCSTG